MGLGSFFENLLEFEISKSLTSFHNDQLAHFVPRNDFDRKMHQCAFAKDSIKFKRSYPDSLQVMIEEFLRCVKNDIFLDGKGNPNLTKSALYIRDATDLFNPFPTGGGKSMKQKNLRRHESSINGLNYIVFFHPGTKDVFQDQYYKAFHLTPPRRRKELPLFLQVWQNRYFEEYALFKRKFDDLVVENHLFLYLMELIASGSYVGKSAVDRYQFMLEIKNGYPWYSHSKTGTMWKACLRYENLSDILKLEQRGKKVPRRNPIIDQHSGCLSGYLDVMRDRGYDENVGIDHLQADLRVLISQVERQYSSGLDILEKNEVIWSKNEVESYTDFV